MEAGHLGMSDYRNLYKWPNLSLVYNHMFMGRSLCASQVLEQNIITSKITGKLLVDLNEDDTVQGIFQMSFRIKIS